MYRDVEENGLFYSAWYLFVYRHRQCDYYLRTIAAVFYIRFNTYIYIYLNNYIYLRRGKYSVLFWLVFLYIQILSMLLSMFDRIAGVFYI